MNTVNYSNFCKQVTVSKHSEGVRVKYMTFKQMMLKEYTVQYNADGMRDGIIYASYTVVFYILPDDKLNMTNLEILKSFRNT